jgi:hypothetical protein
MGNLVYTKFNTLILTIKIYIWRRGTIYAIAIPIKPQVIC